MNDKIRFILKNYPYCRWIIDWNGTLLIEILSSHDEDLLEIKTKVYTEGIKGVRLTRPVFPSDVENKSCGKGQHFQDAGIPIRFSSSSTSFSSFPHPMAPSAKEMC